MTWLRLKLASPHRLLPARAAVGAVLIFALAACSGDVATPTAPPSEGLRDQTIAVLTSLTSVSFEVHHPAGGTDMGGGMMLNTVEGVAAFPSSARMSAQGVIERIAVRFGIIQTDDTIYFSGPIGDTWRIVPPGTLPFDFVGMNASVATALANATELTAGVGGSIGGQPTFVLRGRIVSDDLIGLVPGATPGLPLSIETWVTQGSGLPVRVLLSGSLISSDPETMVRQLDLRDFDEPVSVLPPI